MHVSTIRRLLERGRALSRANETKLRSVITTIETVLASVRDGQAVSEGQQTEMAEAARLLTEAELSHDEQRHALQQAVRAATERYCWVVDIYDTWFVYSCYDPDTDEQQLFRAGYLIDESGAVTLGTATAVRSRVVYEPIGTAQESAQRSADGAMRLVEAACTSLVEAVVREDGTIPIKVIAPGWGSSGYYSPEVLKRDGPQVFAAGTHMYWNHATETELFERPERENDDLAARLTTDAAWQDDGPAGPGLYANAEVAKAYREKIDDIGTWIGTSINTDGTAILGEAEGRTGYLVQSLVATPFTSVDFVTKPGAGGTIIQAFEAARARRTPTPLQESSTVPDSPELTTLREANAQLQAENARLQEATRRSSANAVLSTHLASKTTLHEATRQRIVAQMQARVDLPLTEGALDEAAYRAQIDEAITAEETYVAALTAPSGDVSGMGDSTPPNTTMTLAEAEAALADSLQHLGLTESGAKTAAHGR